MSTDIDTKLSALETTQRAFERVSGATQPWSQELVKFLVVSVLAFAAVALILAAALLWRSAATPQQILRVFVIICIVGLSATLLVVGYNNEQLTPIVGLFGAIAGYVLGKDTKASDEE